MRKWSWRNNSWPFTCAPAHGGLLGAVLAKPGSASQRPSAAPMNFLSSSDTVAYNTGSGGQIRDKQKLPGACLGNFSFSLSVFRSRL